MKKATMADVARLARVSPSTVSHVINHTAPISEATAERVRAAIEQLNYSPNLLARSLRHEKSGLIGVVLNDITSEFYASCIQSILETAREDQYNLVICDTLGNAEVLESSVQNLLDNRIDGFVFLGGMNDAATIEKIVAANIPIVLCDRSHPTLPSVEYNNEETYRQMVCALYDSGYRRFMYIGESLDIQTNLLDRYNGYLDGLKQCGLQNNKMDLFRRSLFQYKMSVSFQLFDELIELITQKKQGPDVIVTSNDTIAHGLIAAAAIRGVKVPDDVAVVGCDDIRFSSCYSPKLTTIHQDSDRFGKEAYRLLRELIQNENQMQEDMKIILPQTIVPRESAIILPEVQEKYNLLTEE